MTADFSSDRIELAKSPDFRLGEILVCPSTRQVRVAASSETLEPRIMQVLVALARRAGHVVSRDDLIQACWEGRIVGGDALNRCISKIRKLGEAHQSFELETIPRVGYRMSPVSGAEASRSREEPSGERGDAPTLAVLPFTNRSGSPEDEVFALGMVEDVIAALAQGVNVRVLAGFTTAGIGKDVSTDLAALARKLGARYLLGGNVRRVDDNLRVTTQVVEASTGSVLWTGSFERPLSELAALQEDLVVEVAATLEIRVQTLELQRALKKPGDLTAWEAMFRAFAFQRKGDPASLMRAIEEAQRAVTIAPGYGVAHSLLAQTLGVLYLFASPHDPAAVQHIHDHVDRALALDPDDLFALGNCAQALNYIGHPEEALVHLTRAVRKAPNLGPLHFGLGSTYCLLNRPDEALASLDEASVLMPEWAYLFYLKGWQANALARAGRWDETETMTDEALALNSDYPPVRVLKAIACRRRQGHAEARAVFAAVAKSGQPLEQVLTSSRRIYANSSIQDDILAAIRALWTESAAP